VDLRNSEPKSNIITSVHKWLKTSQTIHQIQNHAIKLVDSVTLFTQTNVQQQDIPRPTTLLNFKQAGQKNQQSKP